MKILFISECFPPHIKGGAEISTCLISKEISKYHKVYVLTGRYHKKTWKIGNMEVFADLKKVSLEDKTKKGIVSFGLSILPSTIINSKIIKDFVKKYKIDVIHIVPTTLYMIPSINALINLQKRINVDVRDLSLIYPPDNRKKRNIFRYFVFLYELFIFNVYSTKLKFLSNRYKKIRFIALSNFIKEKLIKAGYPKEKIKVIKNISESSKINFKTINKKNKLIFAGRLEKDKGIWDAIYAFELLKDKNLVFEIAGKGSELKNIKDYMTKKNIKNIKLLGELSNEKVLKLYSQSKIILGPSIVPEAFGRFIQEGISTRTPVIATRVGGIPEGIKDHETGLLVEPNNPGQLAKAIKELLTDKKLYNKIVKNLGKEAKKYSPEVIGKQRLKVYEELLKDNKK